MKYLLIFYALLLGSAVPASAQNISFETFNSLVTDLETGDYTNAFNKSRALLEGDDTAGTGFRPLIVYVNIISAAGLVSQKKLTHDQLLGIAEKFKGQKISSLPAFCADSNRIAFRTFCFHTDGQGQHITFTSCNNDATSIFVFEKYLLAQTAAPADFIGKQVIATGILDTVAINENRSTIWIARMTVRDTELRTVEFK